MLIMSIYFLLTIFVSVAQTTTASTTDRWNKLMVLVNQELKILESTKRKNVEIKYRILELHSEKLKLIHEKNNNEFFKHSKVSGSGSNKERFFGETRLYYKMARAYGDQILKDHPQNNRKAEIMFAMALNSRDYGLDNITEKYLLEVIRLTTETKQTLRHHAQTAIADHYYNEKKYPQAISFYEKVIKNTEDSWYTKHLFNLSWCYLKNRDFDKAITAINHSYFASKKSSYIDIRDQVLENIGSFYVYTGRPLEGLKFYLDNEKNPLPYLLPMALKASEKGHERETLEILNAAQKVVKKSGLLEYQEELYHTYLDFFNHYKRFFDHEKTTSQMVNYYQKALLDYNRNKKSPLKVDLLDAAIEKMRTVAGYLQIKLSKDVKADESQFVKEELDLVLSYFSHLMILDPKKKAEYLYYQAETYYSVNQFKPAAASYQESIQIAKIQKQNDIIKRALNSLFSLTATEKLEKDLNDQYLIFGYTQHLETWPRDELSRQIYPKLFEMYHQRMEIDKAPQVVAAFNKAYPEFLNEQQALMTKTIDHLIEKKNTEKINYWISQFHAGFLSFSKETISKIEIILGNILFLQYQDLAKNGKRLEAAKGFEDLYAHKLYPDKVKYQAAFFASMAYLELGLTEESFKWQKLAHHKMTATEKLERLPEQVKMAERTYKLQDFHTSYENSVYLLNYFCQLKDETQTRLYEIAVMTSLIDDQPLKAERTIKDFSKCLSNKEVKTTSVTQVFDYLEKQGDFFALRSFMKRLGTSVLYERYRFTIQKWYWEIDNLDLRQSILAEYKDLKHPETLTWLEELNLFHEAQKYSQEIKSAIIWSSATFDGDHFNKSLENYLLKVKKFKDRFQSLTQSSQLDLVIVSTKLFANFYQDVGNRILGINPQGLDKEIVKQFQQSMIQVAKPFLMASKQYDQGLEKALKSKSHLAWGSRSIAVVEDIENPVFSFFTGLTMDSH